jgi:predicted  nucleic acid-binding Zn-ribbon protein
MRALVIAFTVLAAAPVFAQRAPGAPTAEAAQAQIARLQIEMSKNEEARRRIDSELREMERRANELRIEQQRLQNEYVRMQSELLLLQQQAR